MKYKKNIDINMLSLIWRFFTTKFYLYIILSSFISFVMIYFLLFYQSPLDYFTANTNNTTVFFNDKYNDGQSEVLNTIVNQNEIGLKFILKNGFDYPYVGIEIGVANQKYFDVSKYNRVEVCISGQEVDHVLMNLHIDEKMVKDKSNPLAIRRVSHDFYITANKQVLELDMDNFETPNWWYSILKQSKKDFDKPDMSKLVSIAFSNGVNQKLDIPNSFSVFKIRFLKDNTIVVWVLGILELLVIGICFLFYYFKFIDHKTKKIEINYVPVVVDKKDTTDNVDFYSFIHENYADPELNLVQIAKHFRINQREISDSISQKYECNFKTYINQVRINEAKRLMLESSLNISEIGYKVGFNSPTNFYRVFKSLTDLSPSEFLQNINK